MNGNEWIRMENVQMNRISVAVIGSGYWGKNLVRNYHQLGALKIICDKNEDILKGFKEQYPYVDICLAVSDVLRRKDIKKYTFSKFLIFLEVY